MNLSRPRPVLTSAGIAGGITSLAGVLTFLGYDHASAHLSDSTSAITAVAIGVVGLGSHLLAALHGQGKVTPVTAPQDHDGMPLIRADIAASSPTAPALAASVDDLDDTGDDGLAAAAAIDAENIPADIPATPEPAPTNPA